MRPFENISPENLSRPHRPCPGDAPRFARREERAIEQFLTLSARYLRLPPEARARVATSQAINGPYTH